MKDPATWTRPWSGEMAIRAIEGPIYEYACQRATTDWPTSSAHSASWTPRMLPRRKGASNERSCPCAARIKFGLMYDLIRQLLVELGEDPTREGLERTPDRVEKALKFLTGGYTEKSTKCQWRPFQRRV